MSTPLARPTDPLTSDLAIPTAGKREEQKRAILALLAECGPMTDHELTWQYVAQRSRRHWPATQNDSVRKRRAELKNAVRVIDTGRVSGVIGYPASVVWAIAP